MTKARPLDSNWFAGVAPEDKASHEQFIRNSTIVLDLLTKVIERNLKATETVTLADYDRPGYAYWRADRDGARRVLSGLLNMTKLT